MKSRGGSIKRGLSLGLIFASFVWCAGCRSLIGRPQSDSESAAPVKPYIGEIVKVSQRGHVIVACTDLPSTGEEARVYRDGQFVGKVRFEKRGRTYHAAARVLAGEARTGDIVLRR